jgi:hypothetical protein
LANTIIAFPNTGKLTVMYFCVRENSGVKLLLWAQTSRLIEVWGHASVFPHLRKMPIPTTGASSGAGTAYPSGTLEFIPVFSWTLVTRFLVLCVCFVDRCLSFCPFSFGCCVVCSSSIYGF